MCPARQIRGNATQGAQSCVIGAIARHGGTPAFTQGYGGQAAGTSEGKKRNKW